MGDADVAALSIARVSTSGDFKEQTFDKIAFRMQQDRLTEMHKVVDALEAAMIIATHFMITTDLTVNGIISWEAMDSVVLASVADRGLHTGCQPGAAAARDPANAAAAGLDAQG